jgi:2,4-dienoyl-CoA reductase-like NADH-dependent reductase (Old Yellow Enzyme family)/thioredoxin reductase
MTGQLLSGVQIGPLTLKNRIVFSAPGPAYGGLDENANRPTGELGAYWEHQARGGVGLLVTEAQGIHPTSILNPRTVENTSDEIIPLYRPVADAIHDGGAKVIGHLWHAGFLGATGYRSLPLWAPSAIRAPMGAAVPAGGGAIPYAMSQEDIRTIVDAFAAAARRLREATFDGVEVDAAHAFLLAEFLSPKVNLRTDEYGGSLENRCRIVVEILKAVREAVGPGLAVGVRLSADPYIEPGLVEKDLPEIAKHLAQAAAPDYISVMPALLPDASCPEGVGSEVARSVRQSAGIPVLYSGLVTDPGTGESLLAGGDIDLVGMTRALLADSELPVKVAAGHADQIRTCVACNQTCSGLALATPYCLLNPTPVEVEGLKRTADGQGKRVLVIGAGLAGLEVARLARMRGFAVTIWERDTKLGGQARVLATIPQRARFQDAVTFYERQLGAWGIELCLGREATVEAVEALNPDAVVIATGSSPAMPSWATSSNGHTPDMSVLDIRAAITDGAKLGKRVVVAMAEVDRGEQALAVAEFLVDRGHQVTVVSPALEPSINQEFFTSEQAYRRLLPKKVRFLAVTEVTGVRPGEVDTMNVYTLRPGTVPADSVVVSHGGVANDSLIDQLQLRRPNVFSAGDCIAPRDIAGAISDGMRVMEKLVAVARQ